MPKELFEILSKNTFWFMIIAGIIMLIIVFRKRIFGYFKESITELKKTTWPTPKKVQQLFFVVLFISLLFSFIVGAFDLTFTKIFEKFLNY